MYKQHLSHSSTAPLPNSNRNSSNNNSSNSSSSSSKIPTARAAFQPTVLQHKQQVYLLLLPQHQYMALLHPPTERLHSNNNRHTVKHLNMARNRPYKPRPTVTVPRLHSMATHHQHTACRQQQHQQ